MFRRTLRPLPGAATVLSTAVIATRLGSPAAHAQAGTPPPPPIVSMTVLDDNNVDTHKAVLAPRTFLQPACTGYRTPMPPIPPGRCPINSFGGLGETSDEMQTIFPPGGLGTNADYLFWVATHTAGTSTGATVLSGGVGPNKEGWWTLNFTHKDRYGRYATGWGPVLLPVSNGSCLLVPSLDPKSQDQTFDLNYAAPGTVVADPTTPGRLFMVYEGSNACAGFATAVNPSFNAYIATAIATSLDYGHSWPVYRSPDQPKLPGSLHSWPGPNAPFGAFGASVYEGNAWHKMPPADYGRYPVLTPLLSVKDAITAGQPLGGLVGDGEPSAFLDDASSTASPNLYIVHGYKAGPAGLNQPTIPDGRSTDLMLAQATLNGSGLLNFFKWYAPEGSSGTFSQQGSNLQYGGGGLESPILQDGAYENCGDPVHQGRHMGAIKYVEETKQYLLTFVCDSPGDPAMGLDFAKACKTDNSSAACGPGHSWFFATSYDPSDPAQWSAPQPVTGQAQPREITGSWSKEDGASCGGTNSGGFEGWYPTFMSLGRESGHLSTRGYAFYMWGCQGGGESRLYMSRAFRITTTDTTLPVTTASVAGPLGLNGWYVGPTTLIFSATDDQSGVAVTESSLDNGKTWVTGTIRTLHSDGIHVVLFRSIDVDGNIEANESVTVPIDSTPPVTTATATYVQFTATGPAYLQIDLVAQDNVSGVWFTEYSLDDGATWTTGTSLQVRNGTYTLLFRSTDKAGNVEATQSSTYTVSSLSP